MGFDSLYSNFKVSSPIKSKTIPCSMTPLRRIMQLRVPFAVRMVYLIPDELLKLVDNSFGHNNGSLELFHNIF